VKQLTIYTDGACSYNPGPGGCGIVLMYGEHRKELSFGYYNTTNNRMEMRAVIHAIDTLKEPCKVDLFTDSRYIVDAVNKEWVYRWRSNNWMRNKSDKALNVDLWELILLQFKQHKITLNWVKGHSSNSYNNRCDELARQASANPTLYDEGYDK